MDLATLLGFLGSMGVVAGAIFLGGSVGMFLNIPSLVIVVGGTFTATLMKWPLSTTLGAFKVALKGFFNKPYSSAELIEQGIELANIARKEGVLGLEKVEVENPFLAKGIQLAVDGQEPEFVAKILSKDINLAIDRHDQGKKIFVGMGDSAPAMGMIGTLIGLVQMMANMEDPSSIGPAMAVALLTTLYGAVLANAMALPLADKLAYISDSERLNKSLILEIVAGIQEGLNPRVMEDLLKTYIPEGKRGAGEAEAA